MLTHQHKIKLGIDAKWYFSGPPSGNVVVKNLVDEIVADRHNFELYLIVSGRYKKAARLQFPADVKILHVPAAPNLMANVFILPVLALLYRLDVMLFQNFTSTWPKRLFKIAYIHDVLFLDYPQYYTKAELLYFKRMKSLATAANKIFTISNTEKSRLVSNNVALKKNISVVYHGISKKFKPLEQYPAELIKEITLKYSLPEKYLLYVGRVNIRKNLMNLVSALSKMKDTSIKLVIAGMQDNTQDDIHRYIKQLNLTNRVIFTGFIPEKDIYLLYACATVFCFPSYAEGFGLPPLEAMQCGVPVVVSNRTAMPEVCGSAAVYANPDDAMQIANQIDKLLTDDFFYRQKVAEGIEHARHFTWKRSAGELLTSISRSYGN